MINDTHIQKAIAAAAKKKIGKQSEISRITGLSTGTISRMVRGEFKKIDDDTYPKLYPIIAPWLPKDADGLPRLRYRPADELDRVNLAPPTSMAIADAEPWGNSCPRCQAISPAALAIARQWDTLCPEQQAAVNGYLAAKLEDAATKKDSHSVSVKTA